MSRQKNPFDQFREEYAESQTLVDGTKEIEGFREWMDAALGKPFVITDLGKAKFAHQGRRPYAAIRVNSMASIVFSREQKRTGERLIIEAMSTAGRATQLAVREIPVQFRGEDGNPFYDPKRIRDQVTGAIRSLLPLVHGTAADLGWEDEASDFDRFMGNHL